MNNYSPFENIVLDTLNRHAPMKKKLLRGFHAPYVTKTLRKAIMKRSNLQTKYFKGATKLHLTYYLCVVSCFQYGFILVCIFYLLFWETSFSSFCVWCVFWNLNSTPYYRIIRFRIIAFIELLFLYWPSGHLWFYSSFINITNQLY